VEHPGQSAGPKVPDEERKGVHAGAAGHDAIGEKSDFSSNVPFYKWHRRRKTAYLSITPLWSTEDSGM